MRPEDGLSIDTRGPVAQPDDITRDTGWKSKALNCIYPGFVAQVELTWQYHRKSTPGSLSEGWTAAGRPGSQEQYHAIY